MSIELMKTLVHTMGLVLLFTVLPACESETQEEITKPIEIIKSIRGHYIFGYEENSFKPCGDEKTYWVVGANEIMAKLESEYDKIATEPYQDVYIIFIGDFTGKAEQGFAADYDGQFMPTEIIEIRNKTEGDCQ